MKLCWESDFSNWYMFDFNR